MGMMCTAKHKHDNVMVELVNHPYVAIDSQWEFHFAEGMVIFLGTTLNPTT